MNDMSLREKALLAVIGMIALYAFAVILWFTAQESAWAKARKAYDKAKTILAENREKLETLAKTLLERETMDGRDVEELVKGSEDTENTESPTE